VSKPNQVDKKELSKKPYRWLRRILRTLFGIILVLFLLILFVRSPWGQDIIKDKLVNYITDKTNTRLDIEKLFITFDGNVQLDGLYVEDKVGDTLVYSKSLEANIPLWQTITGQAYGLDNLKWNGLKANIIRKDSISGFNYQFLIDAFASNNSDDVKDVDKESVEIVLGDFNFSDFNIQYFDQVSGIDSKFKIGNLDMSINTIDLDNMVFDTNAFILENSDIKFHLTPSSETQTSEKSATVLPKLSVGELQLNTVKTDFKTPELSINGEIANFYTEIPEVNMAEEVFVINTIQLKDSQLSVNINEIKNEDNNAELAKSNNKFSWPKIQVEVANLLLENNNFQYTVNQEKPARQKLNPNAIYLSNVNLEVKDVLLKEKQAGLKISRFSLVEYSGINLKNLTGEFSINDQNTSAENLDFRLNNSRINGFVQLNYKNIQQLLEDPDQAKFKTNLSSILLSVKDLFVFQPKLENNPYLKTLSKNRLEGNLKVNGTVGQLDVTAFNIAWGKDTRLSTTAKIQNVTKGDSIKFNVARFSVKTKRSDFIKFIDEQTLGVSLPEDIQLSGDFNGTLKELSTQLLLESSQGELTLKGDFQNQNVLKFNSNLSIKNYRLNELLDNSQLGQVSLELTAKGTGADMNTLDAKIDLMVSELDYNKYTFRNLDLNGEIKNGQGNFVTNYKDENLNLKLDASVKLDSVETRAKANLSLKGADLYALGLLERDIKTGFDLTADFSKINETLAIETSMKDGVVVYNNESYLIGSFDTSAIISNDTTQVDIDSRILKLNLKANSNPQQFSQAISDHINGYFYENETITDSVEKPVKAEIKGKISQSPLLNDVFLVNLKDMDTINFALDFDKKNKLLEASINAPHINYAGSEIDSLKFAFNSNPKTFNFNFSFDGIETGPINIPKTTITGKKDDTELSMIFEAIHDNEPLIYVHSRLDFGENRLKFSLDNDSLIINSKRWAIPENNSAVFKNDTLVFNNFNINRNDQSIEITNKFSAQNNPQIALDFKNFKLSQFLNYLNPDSELATGRIDGTFVLENPFSNTGIIADMSVSQLEVLKADFGTLNLNANSTEANSYDFNASLKEGEIDLDFNGNYLASEQESKLNMRLDINKFQVKAFNDLALGEIEEGTGSFSGHLDLKGTTQNPKYHGKLNFTNAGFKVSKLNTSFILNDETLWFDNDGIRLDNFTVRDAENNKLLVSGEIGTGSFINPTFDLQINASDFKILDANKGDNDLFYGKAIFDAKAKLKGNLQVPKLDAELKVNSKTDFVYILPSNTASIQKRDGIVTFVNRENPEAILSNDEVQKATIRGLDITSKLIVNKEAKFKIIIDKDSGDNFQVQGKGDLNFRMFPNGRINLYGIYEATKGHYDLSLYNLVKRKFILVPGSKVIWNGDPFNAELDVKAIYNVETSASSLMAAQISSLEPAAKSKYRQVLPFEVYLNIENELLQPEISFRLDMPDEEKDAIGGQIYSRMQQVNQQEAELNQQVFSLLVLNRFYPTPGGDGSSGGIKTLAQENLNDAIADQLNAYSDKILGNSGVDLDFGLDSYTDYQGDSPTERTQLNVAAEKKLFNDRLTVRVGSDINVQGSSPRGENTPILGNVSLVYELTKDGRYRLKGFTKNNFENVIDGQTIVSGIALIFNQEFNKFEELWEAIFRKTRNEENTEDSEEKNATSNQNEKK
jgi:hypothetical protein